MSVLLMRLAGPMQSWGTQSRFPVRDTGREPSKSGVVGLLCASLGRRRNEPVDDLAGLGMAVRVDREGLLARDYHTAQEQPLAGGRGTDTILSTRYYLSDAEFLVGLEGGRPLLERLDGALRQPVWPLYLGRKSFVPGRSVALPVSLEPVRDGELLDVLKGFFWLPRRRGEEPQLPLRYVSEVRAGGEPRQDVPLSFAERRFAVRRVEVKYLDESPPILPREDHSCI